MRMEGNHVTGLARACPAPQEAVRVPWCLEFLHEWCGGWFWVRSSHQASLALAVFLLFHLPIWEASDELEHGALLLVSDGVSLSVLPVGLAYLLITWLCGPIFPGLNSQSCCEKKHWCHEAMKSCIWHAGETQWCRHFYPHGLPTVE